MEASLRAAAEDIGTDPSNVTRWLAGLEQRLGIKLITRSRVRSTATEASQRSYRELKPLLEQLAARESDIAGAATEPRGACPERLWRAMSDHGSMSCSFWRPSWRSTRCSPIGPSI